MKLAREHFRYILFLAITFILLAGNFLQWRDRGSTLDSVVGRIEAATEAVRYAEQFRRASELVSKEIAVGYNEQRQELQDARSFNREVNKRAIDAEATVDRITALAIAGSTESAEGRTYRDSARRTVCTLVRILNVASGANENSGIEPGQCG